MINKKITKSSNCTILDSWVLLADEPFAKALQILETCVLVDILCGKLVSLSQSTTTFDGRFKVTSVPAFIPDMDLLSCELDNFTFKVLY